jgi:hypothetical protein
MPLTRTVSNAGQDALKQSFTYNISSDLPVIHLDSKMWLISIFAKQHALHIIRVYSVEERPSSRIANSKVASR